MCCQAGIADDGQQSQPQNGRHRGGGTLDGAAQKARPAYLNSDSIPANVFKKERESHRNADAAAAIAVTAQVNFKMAAQMQPCRVWPQGGSDDQVVVVA